MCGYIGLLNINNINTLQNAWSAVSWRGNVYGGYYSSRCTVLATRLPRTGDKSRPQPVVFEDGSLLALNGEVYNVHELANNFIPKIEINDDLSDTEVLALILRNSISTNDIIRSIKGEFALAYYDSRNSSLLLTRDLFGSKPLFWSTFKGGYGFGSSAKAVALLNKNSLNPDWTKVRDIIEFGVTPTANIFENVESIQAGEIKIIKDDSIISDSFYISTQLINEEKVFEQLRIAALSRSISSPTGLAFSGGIDSSVLRSFMPKIPSYKILLKKTVPLYGEKNIIVEPILLESELRRMWQYVDRPISTLSPVGMSLLASTMRRDGLDNMISGEGADELFCGYPHRFYSQSQGHPVLIKHQAHFAVARKLLKLVPSSNTSDIFLNLLKTKSSDEWGYFDRWIRLPQHLTLSHSDIPSLINQIEARLPYSDLGHIYVDNCIDYRESKKVLKNIFQKSMLSKDSKSQIKDGLFIPCGIFDDSTLRRLAAESGIQEEFGLQKPLLQLYDDAVKQIEHLSIPVKHDIREIIARVIIQLSSLTSILKIPTENVQIVTSYTLLKGNRAFKINS